MKYQMKQTFWSVIAIALTLMVVGVIYLTRSEVKKETIQEQPRLVKTFTAKKGDERITIEAFGTVQANREVLIRPEVSGRVVMQSPSLVIGGSLSKSQILLKINPQDYEILIEQEKAAVEKAEFDLQVEWGKQIVAKREWEQLNPSIKTMELSEELALRKPHLREKKAALDAAKSRLEKAELDLARTVIYSPMNSIVLSEASEVGEYITPQTTIATLAATDEFRVQVSIPYSKLSWIEFPNEKGQEGSLVFVNLDLGNGNQVTYSGKIERLLGNLDPTGRMARVIITVNNPLESEYPLLIGSYVRVEIAGPIKENVFAIPRDAIREGSQVWIVSPEETLVVRKVHILSTDKEQILVDQGLQDGEEIITSHLALPIPGMKLHIDHKTGQ